MLHYANQVSTFVGRGTQEARMSFLYLMNALLQMFQLSKSDNTNFQSKKQQDKRELEKQLEKNVSSDRKRKHLIIAMERKGVGSRILT